MSSLLETFLGHQISGCIDATGMCSHASDSNKPFHICEIEANELNRFDPDAFKALIGFGAVVEQISLEDFDKVGEKVSLLKSVLSSHGDGKNEFLYKYAMAQRVKKPLLISKQDPDYSIHVECTKKFKNNLIEFP
ncbi:hypothetical protein GOL24_20965 [Sinorhizobium medicae]|uniref:hypothetical protein n=1 Tax=Sinorhizobium medicae TaxID=110321 RepID=UPI000C7986C7|nr:hypothetical protein [Sinorhizobium medicae]MDX1126750.1 hypothetical protein [Sinorhizobium medicae]MDX1230213.1 hypothetical protein [Sinorhizobium medicae]PLU25396.1 hypothetical protein BMJ31_10050 [Sinorhizobium medicae]PLU35244.1 hypothetical protein BMJ28_16915 [Sinorhizobium medicae]PLU57387.1 hypothetical protein BMJ24_17410 [Sinorhizobium medicae]